MLLPDWAERLGESQHELTFTILRAAGETVRGSGCLPVQH